MDALFVPVLPQSFIEGRSRFRRLFGNAQNEMHAYVHRTGFLPLTHTIVMKQSLSEHEPWLAESLMQAFAQSQAECDAFWLSDEKRLSFPDAVFFLEQHRATYGSTSYEHGLARNKQAVETFLRYAYQQEYTSRELSIEQLFPPNTWCT